MYPIEVVSISQDLRHKLYWLMYFSFPPCAHLILLYSTTLQAKSKNCQAPCHEFYSPITFSVLGQTSSSAPCSQIASMYFLRSE